MERSAPTTDDALRKRRLRSACWDALRGLGVARFPGARGRIPNFTGAEAAAARLAGTEAFRRARTILCEPSLAQRPVRLAALRAGKRVLVRELGLRTGRPFRMLDPSRLEARALWAASAITRIEEHATALGVEEIPRIELIVVGSVGVARDGARLGKGGGATDLEYGILRTIGCVGPRTPVVTTVHPSQVLPRGRIPMHAHDLPVDRIVTPERTIDCEPRHARPGGVAWDQVDEDALREHEVLARLARAAHAGGTSRINDTRRVRRPP